MGHVIQLRKLQCWGNSGAINGFYTWLLTGSAAEPCWDCPCWVGWNFSHSLFSLGGQCHQGMTFKCLNCNIWLRAVCSSPSSLLPWAPTWRPGPLSGQFQAAPPLAGSPPGLVCRGAWSGQGTLWFFQSLGSHPALHRGSLGWFLSAGFWSLGQPHANPCGLAFTW